MRQVGGDPAGDDADGDDGDMDDFMRLVELGNVDMAQVMHVLMSVAHGEPQPQQQVPAEGGASGPPSCFPPSLTELVLGGADSKALFHWMKHIHHCKSLQSLVLEDMVHCSRWTSAMDRLLFCCPDFASQLRTFKVSFSKDIQASSSPSFSFKYVQQLEELELPQYTFKVVTPPELRELAACTNLKSLAKLDLHLLSPPPSDVTMPQLTTVILEDAQEWSLRRRRWPLCSLFPNLQTLGISSAGSKSTSGQDVSCLAVALSGMTSLKALYLGSAIEGVYGGVDSLLDLGRELPGLQELCLMGYGWEQKSSEVVLPNLGSMTQLSMLIFISPMALLRKPHAELGPCSTAAGVLQWLGPLQQLQAFHVGGVPGAESEEFTSSVRECLPNLQGYMTGEGAKRKTVQF